MHQIKIVTKEEIEQESKNGEPTILGCVRFLAEDGLVMPDNLMAICDDCGMAIQYRPTAVKTDKKICLECILERSESETITFSATDLALKEATDFLKKEGKNG